MFAIVKSIMRDDDGATMVEYGLLVALIAVVALVAVQTLGFQPKLVVQTA